MALNGQISDKARRCLENLRVAGASTVLELNALDPTAPDHKQTIKTLEQCKYVTASYQITRAVPCTYSLTEKARRLLNGDTAMAPAAMPAAAKPGRFAGRKALNATPPVTYGSMTTGRLTRACADMLAPATRAGAERALQIPSRVGDVLHYRDGRRVQIGAGVAAHGGVA